MTDVWSHLTRFERDALVDIARHQPRSSQNPFWWREKTMPKLAERGLVEPFSDQSSAWRITQAGRDAIPTSVFNG